MKKIIAFLGIAAAAVAAAAVGSAAVGSAAVGSAAVAGDVAAAGKAVVGPRRALVERLAAGGDVIGIVHWGLNTFNDREWGYGDESPEMLSAEEFNAGPIARACKAAGMYGLVVVAKHHDGFCLWPTGTTGHNITKSPLWRSREGGLDYVREMERACRAAGLKFGVYVSPWDRNCAEYGSEKYVEKFHAQLKELAGGAYGELFEVWFDGANGGDGWYGGAKERRKISKGYYRYGELVRCLKLLQPRVCFFEGSEDADFRWPGNERGMLGAEASAWIEEDGVRRFRVCEADFPLRRGWFYHESERGTTKSAAYLMQRYLDTVGNGGTMNIGIAPDKAGRLDAADERALAGFGAMRRELFARRVPAKAPGGKGRFNVVELKEDIAEGGNVTAWEVRADGERVLSGGEIGAKRLRVLPRPVEYGEVELIVRTGAEGERAAKCSLALYLADEELVGAILTAKADDSETDTAKWMKAAAAAAEAKKPRFAVVATAETLAREAWKAAAEALLAKHADEAAGEIIAVDTLGGVADALKKSRPRYVAFLLRADEFGSKELLALKKTMREIDSDPYDDAIWGIVTGLDAATALRIASSSEPKRIENILATTGVDADIVPGRVCVLSDAFPKGEWWMKGADGAIVRNSATGSLHGIFADAWRELDPDFLLTSSHATESNLEMPFSHGNIIVKDGAFAGTVKPGSEEGLVRLGAPEREKVWLAAGNCLIANHTNNTDMVMTALSFGKVNQFVGYIKKTWYGFAGWTTWRLFAKAGLPLNLSHYAACQIIAHRLATGDWEDETDHKGLIWDRDGTVFYGDPMLRVGIGDDRRMGCIVIFPTAGDRSALEGIAEEKILFAADDFAILKLDAPDAADE